MATKQDARGVIISYSYDDLHRLTGISYNTSGAPGVATTPSVAYTYDNNPSSSTKGLLLNVAVGSSFTESFSYDSFKRVSGITRVMDGRSYTTSYQYNQANQITQITYPSNTRVVNISHDNKGKLLSVADQYRTYVGSISYNVSGQVSSYSRGNGLVESFTYDSNRMQMTNQTATLGSTQLMNLTYSYQASAGQNGAGSTAGNAGQLMSMSGTIGGVTESAAYTYDLQGRVVTSNQSTNGTIAQRRFALDRWGNRTGVWDAVSGGSQIQSITLAQSGGAPTNQIASVTSGSTVNYVYDAAGNVTNDGAHSYTHDAENRLVSVDAGATASYSYDHKNQRYKKVVGATSVHYVWEGSAVIAEYDANSGTVLMNYVGGGGKLIASMGSGILKWYLSDRLSVRLVLDANGNIIGRQGHLPYGEEIAGTGDQQKQHFTGYERDSETGLDYAVNRGYSQNVGRFQQADPYKASGYMVDPQSWNRYSYTQNDPTNKIDPLGLLTLLPGGGVFVCYSFGDTTICETQLVPIYTEFEQRPRPRQKPMPSIPGKALLGDKRVRAFKKFLDSKANEVCRNALNAAYPGIINDMANVVASVPFYDVTQIANQDAGFFFPTTLQNFNIPPSVKVGEIFDPNGYRIGNQIIRFKAITEPVNTRFGQKGIYAPGGRNSSLFADTLTGNRNLEHELVHYLRGKTDDDLRRDLVISDDDDVDKWFERGCTKKE